MNNSTSFKLLSISKIIISLSILITLNGCFKFQGNLKPEQLKWSLTQGNKTIIVKGYTINVDEDKHTRQSKYENIKINKNVYLCGAQSRDAMLIPDTYYFRNWISVMNSYTPEQLPKEAKIFIRHASWQNACIFEFNNIPEGKWILILDLWHYLKPTTLTTPNMNITTFHPEPDWAYVSLVINAQDMVIKKSIIFDFKKRIDFGLITRRHIMNPAEISDWNIEINNWNNHFQSSQEAHQRHSCNMFQEIINNCISE